MRIFSYEIQKPKGDILIRNFTPWSGLRMYITILAKI